MLKIQVLTGIDGITFEQCYHSGTELEIGNWKVPLIGFAHLLKSKAASPRAKDKIDMAELKRIREEQ